jgi:acetyl esterase/lipase
MFRDEAKWLAEQGLACACPSYRLAPLHPFPCAVADLQGMICHARSSANFLSIDPQKICVIGNSAGGHLAAMTALLDHPIDPHIDTAGFSPMASCAVAISPITDLTDPRARHLPIAWSFLEQFMACPYEGHELLWKQASPIHHVGPSASPILLIHGDKDDVVPHDQSESLARALEEAGVDCDLHLLAEEMHSFSMEGWFKIRDLYLSWIKEHFGLAA